MLKIRVIPTMLWKDVGLVKGVSFDSWRRTGTLLPAVKVYNTRQVDELILLDIMATRERRIPDYDVIKDISAECFVPFTVGGGIRDISQVRELLRAGADKVCINSGSYTDANLIPETASRFGSQCIVASIDAKRREGGGYECWSHSGTIPTGRDPVAWACAVENQGAGEILITSMERDGTMLGYDLDLIKSVTDAVRIPVIASGGAGKYADMLLAVQTAGASAVAAASIFHFTEQTPMEAKTYLGLRGLPVRNSNVKAD